MDFSAVQKRALEIRSMYNALEEKRHGAPWNTSDIALGFVSDVGDLVKLIMADEGKRTIDDHKAKLQHELADCLWCLFVLADRTDTDLEDSFLRAMDELEKRIQKSS